MRYVIGAAAIVFIAWLAFYGGFAVASAAAVGFFAAIAAMLFAIGLWELFVFGGVAFWLLVICATILVWYFEDNDESGPGIFGTVLVTLLILQFFGDIKIFTWIGGHPWRAILYITLYLPVGILWSGFKYYRVHREYARAHGQEAKALLLQFLRDKKLQSLKDAPENIKEEWKHILESGRYDNTIIAPKPTLRQYWDRIGHWILYWPVSALWYLLGDLIKDILRFIKENLRGFYTNIEKIAYRGLLDDNVTVATSNQTPIAPPASQQDGSKTNTL